MWHRLKCDKCFDRWDTLFISVIIADGIIILHIMKGHWLNDSLHTTQFSSKWQLATFYKTEAIKCKQTQNIKISLNITEHNTNFTRTHSERSASIPHAMDTAEYNTCVINHRRPLTVLKSFPTSRLSHQTHALMFATQTMSQVRFPYSCKVHRMQVFISRL